MINYHIFCVYKQLKCSYITVDIICGEQWYFGRVFLLFLSSGLPFYRQKPFFKVFSVFCRRKSYMFGMT